MVVNPNGNYVSYTVQNFTYFSLFSQIADPTVSTATTLVNFNLSSKKHRTQKPIKEIEKLVKMFFNYNLIILFWFSESNSSEGDEDIEDDDTINDEEIRKALLPSQPTPTTTTAVPPPVLKKRRRNSSTSSVEETKVEIPARPHANVQVERSEEIQAVRSQLPIITEEQAIMEAIHDNLVVLICGETGKKNSFLHEKLRYEIII